MKRLLVIDSGNTRLKATVFSNDSYVMTESFGKDDAVRLTEFVEKIQPDKIVAGSVVGYATNLDEVLKGKFSDIYYMTPDVALPIDISYIPPQSLGFDRIAGCVGAWELLGRSDCVVVDAGTALTVDVVSGGCFRGGNISPGLDLRFNSLHEYTSALPLVASDGEIPSFGYDTETAIRSGVIGGIVAEIEKDIYAANSIYGCRNVIITGGNASILEENIKLENKEIEIVVVNYLVALGIKNIYEYNENN